MKEDYARVCAFLLWLETDVMCLGCDTISYIVGRTLSMMPVLLSGVLTEECLRLNLLNSYR